MNSQGKSRLAFLNEIYGNSFHIENDAKWIDLENTKSVEEAIAFSRGMARKIQPADGQWIQCFGWNEQNWAEKRFLDREDLDRISTKRPVIAVRDQGEIIAVNTRALEMLELLNPDAGAGRIRIARDEEGRPTGILEVFPDLSEARK